ncbi:transcription elongation factor GreA [Patescibacteria group bacterium]
MNQTLTITKQGLDSLKEELRKLKEVKRPQLVDRLAKARAEGDLKENSDYQNARDDLGFLDGRIEELEHVIVNAKVVQSNGKSNEVAVGTKVTIKTGVKEHTFDIVGEWEADPVQKKISNTSPLGSALEGKKVGEKVEVDAPAGRISYEILSIK